jgi:tRNA (cytidine/uridine-2'-O-)-methyltransferase
MMMNVVLYQPEIPANTGNIARLCAATDSGLHLIAPLGFSLEDRYLRRAGLDYWPLVRLYTYGSMQELYDKYPDGRFFYLSSKATLHYTQVRYAEGDFIVLGPETRGLPVEILDKNAGHAITIPMEGPVRSLNLSTAAGVALYEALRQVRGY